MRPAPADPAPAGVRVLARPARVLISGGFVVDPSQRMEAARDVLLEGGRVKALLPPGRPPPAARRRMAPARAPGNGAPGPRPGQGPRTADGARVLDARGLWVIPGAIDMHVHLREPGREGDESIASGTRAAARGGVTTVLAMPNTDPVIDTAAMVHFLRDRARTDGRVNVLVAGAVSRGQLGAELAELGKMAAAGASAFSDDGRPVASSLLLRRALEYARITGLPILDHCEDEALANGGVMHEGRAAAAKGLRGIPAAAEAVAAMRDAALAELTGGRLHLCHVSCARTVEVARRAKARGARLTAEAAPHHFALTDEDIPGYDADFKMNPPLRSREDVEAVLRGLADGTLDAIATDHAPHSPSKKALGLTAAPFGVIGLETLLPLTLDLWRRKILPRRRAVELLTSGPARVLGLKSKGGLRPGMDADVTLLDPDLAWTVPEQGESRSRNSPWKGRRLRGRAVTVLVGGVPVLERGYLLTAPAGR